MHQASKTTKHSSCNSRNSACFCPRFCNTACMRNRQMHVQMHVVPNVSEKHNCILTACTQWMHFNASSIKNNQAFLLQQQKQCLFLSSFLQRSTHENGHTHVQMHVILSVSEKHHCILNTCPQQMWFNKSSIKNNQAFLMQWQKQCQSFLQFVQCGTHEK